MRLRCNVRAGVSNVQYERTAFLLAAEFYERRADLAREYGEDEDEKIFRGTVGRVRAEAEKLRLVLIGGK